MFMGPASPPLFFCGDALEALREIPDSSIDFCMTSPPYWGKREYSNGGVGLEKSYGTYIRNLAEIFAQVKRTLKPEGSFWLNIGDTYLDKRLLGIPWRLACHLSDNQGWILRDAVVWHKLKGGPDNTLDRLRDVYEQVFHFVKIPRGYYFDPEAIRSNPGQAKVVGGKIVSATGVSGVRYKRQIELSTSLSDDEKQNAFSALDGMLSRIEAGELADFRMIIRGAQRTTHSDSIRTPFGFRGGQKSFVTKDFTSCLTIRVAVNPAMFGKYCLRIHIAGTRTLPLTPKTFARSPFWLLARKEG